MKLPFVLLFVAAVTAASAQPALTIYNQDFAVIRETVPLDLKPGVNEVKFADVTSQVEPDSVVLRDPAGGLKLQLIEQGYRSDAVSQGLLLSLYEGKTIDFLSTDSTGGERRIRGEIVRSGYVPGGRTEAPIIKVDGTLRLSLPGEPLFPALADDTVLKPTLSWHLESDRPSRLNAELSYVTEGLSWSAAYNFVAPESGETVDVIGRVTMLNTRGKTFENALVKLMAGDVAKLAPTGRIEAFAMMDEAKALGRGAAPVVTEKAFDEFHLYSLAHPLTLHDGETKQVEFMSASSVVAPVIYVYDGASYRTTAGNGRNYGATGNTKIWVMREFKNSGENHLGMPWPAGRLRLYRRDAADGRLEFVGEDEVDHTPRNETVRVYTGDSFDLVGERRQTSSSNGSIVSGAPWLGRQDTQSFEIKLRNRKTVPVEIRVVEHLVAGENWEIVQNSASYVKTSATTVEFRLTVDPNVEQTLTYTAHYTWR